MPMDNGATEKKIISRTMIKATSNERVKKCLELCNGNRQKLADSLGVSAGHIHDVLSERSKCSKLLDVACEAILRRFQQEKGNHRSMLVLRMDATAAAVIRPLIKALDIKPGFDTEVWDHNVEMSHLVIFAVDHLHYATFRKVINSLEIESWTFNE